MENSFRTLVEVPPAEFRITHRDTILSIGSCFANTLGAKLINSKFESCVNPFGIVYNPISMMQGMEHLLDRNFEFHENDLVNHLGLWSSFKHHGSFSHPDKSTALRSINSSLALGKKTLESANVLLLTLGTSNVFIEKETHTIVANCHKFPASHFDTLQLSAEEIIESLHNTLKKIISTHPELRILITVSPVRHQRNGFHENQLSKAKLLLAAEEVSKRLHPAISYFPAYELMLDELRDYRFYGKDMLHPNEIAIDYIWEKFSATYFNKSTRDLIKEIASLQKSLKHRTLHPGTAESEKFTTSLLDRLSKFQTKHDYLTFHKEIEELKTRSNV